MKEHFTPTLFKAAVNAALEDDNEIFNVCPWERTIGETDP